MTADVRMLPQVSVPLGALTSAPRNPNKMPAHKYAGLREFIRRNGLAQELVVWHRPDGAWEIVDGHHRVKAVRELGWPDDTMIPARDATELVHAERLELALSLNNNRGELDLTAVSFEIDELIGLGRTPEDLTIVGYTEEEIEALMGATLETTEEDLLDDALLTETQRDPPAAKGVFPLEIELASAKELRRAKSRIKKAGGKGNKDLTKGLRALLGLDEDDR